MEGLENAVNQPEHAGIDFFGDEIIEGDVIVIDEDNEEVILLKNLEQYLANYCRFTFSEAK